MKKVIRLSEQLYEMFLKFYPFSYRNEFGGEMKYVYSQSINDAYKQEGEIGIVRFWYITLVDGITSLFREILEGGENMNKNKKDILMQNKIFGLIALGTAAILTIPYLAMRYSWVKPDPNNPADMGVFWTLSDFILMGILLFGTGSMFVAIARVVPRRYRLFVGFAVLAAFLVTWVHLAVGIVDSWPLAGS